jgi:acyl-CoA synthetase (AMP-forming)/AMP-acid ligase II
MERARVNGIELEYEITGSGEPVLLIHGSHVAGSFKPLLAQPALTDEYMLIRYHRRGHLDSSPATGPVSIEQQAADASNDGLVRPEAFVVLENSGGEQALEATLRKYMRQHLGGNKTPRAFHFVKSLPETARGKTRTAAPPSAPSRGDRGPAC